MSVRIDGILGSSMNHFVNSSLELRTAKCRLLKKQRCLLLGSLQRLGRVFIRFRAPSLKINSGPKENDRNTDADEDTRPRTGKVCLRRSVGMSPNRRVSCCNVCYYSHANILPESTES